LASDLKPPREVWVSSQAFYQRRSGVRYLSTLVIALAAFATGLFVAQHTPRAEADDTIPLVTQAVDLSAITYNSLPPPDRGTTRKKMFFDPGNGGAMTLGVYIGPIARHYHPSANEFQYVISGTGTEWLGKKRVALKPGILLVIPKGVPHGGVTGRIKIIEIKTPPQQGAADYVPIH
jgi:mannose-6-phosphate isomerase-like protein (cupin superfamily)